MKITLTKKKAAILVAAALALLTVVGAYAYWTANGTGSGQATVGTDSGVTIGNVAFGGPLYPGGSVNVTFGITNNSSNTAVQIGKVVADTSVGTNGLSLMSDTNCNRFWFSFDDVAVNTSIAAGGTLQKTGTLSMTNEAATNQDACKSATFTLNLKVDNTGL